MLDIKKFRLIQPQLKRLLESLFDPTNGHDHDGVNSKEVVVGAAATVAAIQDPGSATAADCASKINAVLTALKNAGLMAS